MPLTADFNKGNQWGPGRLEQIISGRNELTKDDYEAARAKSAYFAFRPLIEFKIESHEIDARKLVTTRDKAFQWLDQNSTGRWFLDDEFDNMTSPMKIFIERKTDQEKFLALFPDEFKVGETRDHNLTDACSALGLVKSQQEEFKQWIKDNETYSFSRDETGTSIFTFRDEDLKQKFIDENAEHYDLQFISENVCRMPLEKGAMNFPLMGLQRRGEAFALAVDGYHVRYPKQEQMLREKWGDQLTDKGQDDEGRAVLQFTPGEPENLSQIVSIYCQYIEGEIEWQDVLVQTGNKSDPDATIGTGPSLA